jgi:cation diffusion facilitator family transporter
VEDVTDATVNEVRFAGWIGLISNLGLAALKLVAGIVGHSQAVVADAVHSLSDLVTDVAVIVGVGIWLKPADDRHPHGHGRIETLVTVVIGSLLAAVAVGIFWDAVLGGNHPARGTPSAVALVAALASIVTKEILFHWTRAVGRRTRSQALEANAWHHRSDALSSIPAAVAVAVAVVEPSLVVVDRIGAVIVCLFILHAGWRIVSPAIGQLVDAAAPEDDRQRIEQIALSVNGVVSAHALRTRFVGPELAVDLHVEVDASLTVAEGYEIGQRVRKQLIAEGPGVADVLVQVEPYRRPDGASTADESVDSR